jgi:hypothetical protein
LNELTLWLQNLREALSAITAVGATVVVTLAIFLYRRPKDNELDRIIFVEGILSPVNFLKSLGLMSLSIFLWRFESSLYFPFAIFLTWSIGVFFSLRRHCLIVHYFLKSLNFLIVAIFLWYLLLRGGCLAYFQLIILAIWVIGAYFLLFMLAKAFDWARENYWTIRYLYLQEVEPDQSLGAKWWRLVWKIPDIPPPSDQLRLQKSFWEKVKICSMRIENKDEETIGYIYDSIKAFVEEMNKFPFSTLYGVFTNVLETYHQVFRKFLKGEASKSNLLLALEFEIRDVIAEIIKKGLLERSGLYLIIPTINDHLRRHEQEKEYWIAVFDCFWNEFYKDENVPRIAKEELALRDDIFSLYHWQVSCKNLDENKKYATITLSHFIAFLYKRFGYAEIDENLFRALLRLIEALFPEVEPGTWFLCLLFLYCRGFLELLISEPWPWFVWIELEWSIPPPRFTREEKVRNTFELLFNLSEKLDFDLLPGVNIELKPLPTHVGLTFYLIPWKNFFKNYIPSLFAKERVDQYLEIITKLKIHYKEDKEKISKLNRLEELFNHMKEYLSQTQN